LNCLLLASQMNFLVTHIYREGNQCEDILANIRHNVDNLTIWFQIPEYISSSFCKNRLGLPSFRFVTH